MNILKIQYSPINNSNKDSSNNKNNSNKVQRIYIAKPKNKVYGNRKIIKYMEIAK